MLGIGWLKDKWAEAQENKRIRLHQDDVAQQLLTAIRNKDIQAIENALASLETDDGFWRRDRVHNALYSAIRSNDVDVFQKTMELIPNVDRNYIFHDYGPSFPGAGFHYSTSSSLLYEAINAQAEDVALDIVSDPEVDIYSSGEYNKSVYRDGGFLSSGHMEKTKKVYDVPLELAKEKGMNRLAVVLSERVAADMTRQAAQLRNQARPSV